MPDTSRIDRPVRSRPSVFVTTHWSVVLAANGQDPDASCEAIEALCSGYWYPLYAYARRRGNGVHDAQDLTQAFFARLLEKSYLQSVDREKGRFRTFLLVAFKRFLANEWDRANAAKRGGARSFVPLDTAVAESRYAVEPAAGISPEAMYDRRWALTLIERVMNRLREEYAAGGKTAEFEALKGYLAAERGGIPYAEVSAQLGINEGAARMTVHRLRRRFREVFREEIAQTIGSQEEFQDEIRLMMSALAT
jgi:RNA polymerase sigma factor (sigma-70 family)